MTRVTETEMESLSPPVSWRGLSAVYSQDERQLMSALPVREQFSLHVLKSLMGGEIRLGREPHVAEGSEGGSPGRSGDNGPPVYLHEDEIVFGEETKPADGVATEASLRARRKKIYALVWTFQKHRVYKTKTIASRKMRAWKLWKERQGWKVTKLAEGYMAVRGSEREAISLHEYDRETKERLK